MCEHAYKRRKHAIASYYHCSSSRAELWKQVHLSHTNQQIRSLKHVPKGAMWMTWL